MRFRWVAVILFFPLTMILAKEEISNKEKSSSSKGIGGCPDGMVYARLRIKPTVIREFCIDQYEYPNIEGEAPMTGVSWYKAKKICREQGKRLCTDREWQEACRGCEEMRRYPYGNAYDSSVCNSEGEGVLASGKKSKCAGNYGATDMAGNVAEWTAGLGVGSYGGSFEHGRKADCSFWQARSFKQTYADVGFRCCKTLNKRRTVPATESHCSSMDSDYDGIVDALDSCPQAPEDADGYLDQDGCPDADNDADGVPDSADKCPYQKEDRDGFADGDGCPDLDNDQDGYLDSLDTCPDEREDFDGYKDGDGCPDKDNDRDNVPDSMDRCPDTEGSPSNQGCPEIQEPPIKLEVHRSVILEGINFETNSAEFTEESYRILAKIHQALADNPEIRIEVRGHTDNVGGDEFNIGLSQRRANAVRDYLIKRGIDASRITAKGFGKQTPIDTNRTAEGRAHNRRVELYRTE